MSMLSEGGEDAVSRIGEQVFSGCEMASDNVQNRITKSYDRTSNMLFYGFDVNIHSPTIEQSSEEEEDAMQEEW